MKRIEEKGVELGVSKFLMMENAGAAVARYLFNYYGISRRQRITVVAGTGNNGGDAFVAARHLVYWKFRVCVVLIGEEDKIHAEEAAANWRILKGIRAIRKVLIRRVEDISILSKELKRSDAIVCAIFGTGFQGEPREPHATALSTINSMTRALKLSVDIPSGMEADTGESKFSVFSDVTVSMHVAKKGMLKKHARRKCGKIILANIGLPF